MSAVAKREEQLDLPAVPAPEQDTWLALIERAARDPHTNVENMERIMALYERKRAADAKAAYVAALVQMKPQLPVIDKRGRITIHEKGAAKTAASVIQSTPYALWEDIDAQITPILHDHGFVLTFRSGVAQDGKITVTGVLGHEGGHTEETTITLPHDSSGSKNAVQAVGSSTSYGKRYTATMLLNIRTKGEDDDGEKGGTSLLNEDQIEKVFACAKAAGKSAEGICKWLGLPEGSGIPDIQRKDYDRVITALNLTPRGKEPGK
jgi:hypothetical protein